MLLITITVIAFIAYIVGAFSMVYDTYDRFKFRSYHRWDSLIGLVAYAALGLLFIPQIAERVF